MSCAKCIACKKEMKSIETSLHGLIRRHQAMALEFRPNPRLLVASVMRIEKRIAEFLKRKGRTPKGEKAHYRSPKQIAKRKSAASKRLHEYKMENYLL